MAAGAAAPISTSPSPGAASDYVRLHITPLDPELLSIVVPASVRPSARKISFHTVETFPEKRFGFLDLPQMDADRLKKKLNGTVLKGSKLRIENARSEERIEPAGDAERFDRNRKKYKDEPDASKRQKRDPNVLEGVTLKDRKVKRGWTESLDAARKHKKTKDKDSREKGLRKRPKSKYTDREECLLKVKVKLPPNATGNLSQDDRFKKSKKKNKSREVTVHEFERTTQFPRFLRHAPPETNGKPAAEFVDGKGWVDEDGNVVEAVKTRAPAAQTKRKEAQESKAPPEEESDGSTSSSGSSSEEEEEDEENQQQPATEEDQESSAVEDGPKKAANFTTPLSAIKASSSRPLSSSSSKSLTIKIPPQKTPPATKVHPLEALYKRAQPGGDDGAKTPAQAKPFSFFASADGEEADASGNAARPGLTVPMTPFTRQDFERRGMRSAAPNPETAHPSRKRCLWAAQAAAAADDDDDDQVEEDEEEGEKEAEVDGTLAQDRSDFQTWFWDNRRELNRSWMTRRKTAAKEKRHRENKARASRVV